MMTTQIRSLNMTTCNRSFIAPCPPPNIRQSVISMFKSQPQPRSTV